MSKRTKNAILADETLGSTEASIIDPRFQRRFEKDLPRFIAIAWRLVAFQLRNRAKRKENF